MAAPARGRAPSPPISISAMPPIWSPSCAISRSRETRLLGTGDGAEVALLLALAQPGLVRAIVAVDVTGALPASLLDVLPEIDHWVDAPGPGQLAQRAAAISTYGLDGVRAMWQGWKQAVRTLITAGGNISLAQAGAIRCRCSSSTAPRTR